MRQYIKDIDIDAQISEFTINQPMMDILKQIYEKRPDVIALSVYIWNSEQSKKLIRDIKKILPDVILITGGPEVSYNPDIWINSFPEIDYIIKGAGEEGLKYILESFPSEKIIQKKNPHYSLIPFPYIDEDFADGFKNRFTYYEASRGCPFRCSYCLSSRGDQNLEFRNLEDVKKELLFLMDKKNIHTIKFVDRTFNADKNFSREIWKFLIENYREDKKFHFEIYPNILSDLDYELLKTAPHDYFQFEIGIQSVNKKTLNEINRFEKWEEVKPKVKRLVDLQNIHIHLDLIAGLPHESIDEIEISFNEIYSIKADHFQLGFLKVLPGTEMEEKSVEYEIKYSENSPYEILSNKWISFTELIKLHKMEDILEIYSNSGKFKSTLTHLETLHSSYFKLYISIIDFKERHGIEEGLKEWEKNGTVILSYIEENFPDKKNLFLDSLRYDWYRLGRLKHVPQFLKTGNEGRPDKELFELIKEKLDRTDIKNSAYIDFLSDEFKKELNSSKIVFVSIDKELLEVKL